MNVKVISIAAALFASSVLFAQEAERYTVPAEAEVRQAIEQWQDLKFGMFIHWGTYSVTGVIESWSLNPGEQEWIYKHRKGMSYQEYTEFYEGLQTKFNPVNFDPDKWAAAAKDAGMKYVVFTTKHHDGFNMFDTKQNDYKITSEKCPFHSNPKANIAKEIFEAFRNQGVLPGAYFSIADWYNDDYWWDFFPPKNSSPNYPLDKFPEKWAKFLDFMNAQVDELTNGDYGDLQMMWWDLAGAVPADVYDRLVKTARRNQPDIMVVARGVGGIYENYVTPEQTIPEKALDYPWESCITMTHSWSYRPEAAYKPTREILDMLVQIVSRGGNLLLNVGPRPDGTLEDTAYDRLREIGEWMKVNSEGIYGSKAYSTCQDGKVYFTRKGDQVYAYYMADKDETEMPAEICFHGVTPATKTVNMLGCRQALKWTGDGNGGVRVIIPESIRKNPPCDHIWCIRIQL